MRRFLLVRTIRAFLTAFAVVTVTFVVLRITGDPVQTLVPMELQTPEVLARYRALWGLDRPLPVQDLAYLQGILRGEFGTSFADGRPAFAVIAEKVGGTLLLMGPAFLAMLAIGLPAGVAAALNRGGRTDRAVMACAVAGHSLPGYLLGILLIRLLAVEWRVLPSSGSTTWRHMVMPVLTLTLYNGATVARFTRAAVLDVIERPHVRAARAQGRSGRAILKRDILPNAAIPRVTVLGLTLGGLIGGAIVVEWIFAWPGIGRLLVDSVSGRDVWSRLVHAIRISMTVALLGTLFGALLGTLLGIVSAHFGGLVDELIMGIVDVRAPLPFLIFALLVIAFFGNDLVPFVILLGFTAWERYARVVRGLVLDAQTGGCAEAARGLGRSPARIHAVHILPNIALSWWLPFAPGIVIFPTALSVSLLGDWLRDRAEGLRGRPVTRSSHGLARDGADRKGDRPMTRLMTGAAALALALGLGVAAAAKTDIVIGMQQEPTVLDPTADATASIDTLIAHNVMESLTSVTETGEVVPALASSWTVSEDGLTYRFALAAGVTYHDGTAFDASDVKFAFDRAMAADSKNPSKSIFKPIASVAVIDPLTVEITLKNKDAFFLFNIAQGDASIVAPETAETNATNPVGTGPYRFESWNRGDRLVLVKNRAHRNADRAFVEKVTYRFVADPVASVAALMAEEIDAFPGMPAPETLEQFKADPRFTVITGTTEGEVILALNNSKPPFNDLRVRRAINHALDRQAIIQGAMYGYGAPIGSFFPPHHKSYVDLTGAYPHDTEKAKALLKEAGAETLKVTLRLPPFPYARRSGEIVQSQLAKVGIEVAVENVEWAFWLEEVFKKQAYDMTIIAHTSPNDLGNFARGPKYFYGYDNPKFNEIWARIETEADPVKLDALLKDGQRFVTEDAVHGFLFQLPSLGVYRKELTGYRTSAPVLFNPILGWKWNG